jgi:hypothetical protein
VAQPIPNCRLPASQGTQDTQGRHKSYGVARFQPAIRSNIVTALAGVAGQMLVQPLADVISDNVINPLMGAALDRDIPKMDEIRRLEALQIQNNEEVAANDARNAAMRQQRLEDA